METEEKSSTVRSFRLPEFNRTKILKWSTVVGMSAGGIGLMAGGCLMWILGEELLFLTAFISGALFVAGSGLGFIRCLDDKSPL